jgi:hypothetical protein
MGVLGSIDGLDVERDRICIGDAPAEAASCPKLPVYFLADGFSLGAAPLRSGGGE